MLMPLRRYADFSGRSRRTEYWMFVLFVVLTMTAAFFAVAIFVGLGDPYGKKDATWDGILVLGILGFIYLATYLPWLAVQVRRLHDQDLSGWFVLIGYIPYVGWFVILIYMCMEGTRGANRFGPDPKGGADWHAEVFR
jgi:uncharacterized membrane protein YhaH (DUF805 family)